ncbi:MAG TPA: endolytic transglycosylase MltG, partial [Solirubrobacteraceae bacterium]|nr:endolytic transglycosylase MltG [Solirubrobacteraceae bacterium]
GRERGEEAESVADAPESVDGKAVAADSASRPRLPETPPLPSKRSPRRMPRARRVGGVGPPPPRVREVQASGGGGAASDGGGDGPPDAPEPGRASPRGMGTSRPLALAVVLVPVLLVVWLLLSLFQPFAGEGGERVSVRIPDGAGAGEIGTLLAEEGVVDSGFFFRVRTILSGERGGLRSGKYDLREGMSYGAAITALSTPPQAAPPPPVIDVTLPEGLSRQELAPTIKQAGVPGDYVEASGAQRGFRPQKDFDAPAGTDSLEGFLFPATYEVPREGDAEDLVSLQLKAFEDNVAQVDMAEAKRRNLTPYEVLVIASMVEREAQRPEERPLVAAVIHNRLRDGMPLGIDATIRYANDNWDSPLRQSELQADGPYNTRTRTGLPPTPIGNPGLDSIEAAANPADKDFLFYVVKPGTCGEHAFSSTDAQFQQDVARYNQARERAGGRSPTNC